MRPQPRSPRPCAPGWLRALGHVAPRGLYNSHSAKWRKLRDRGALTALAATPDLPAADPQDQELARLRRQTAPLAAELATARKVIEVPGSSPRCWSSWPPAARRRAAGEPTR